MWRGQIGVFAASYRVIAPDLRGFGASDVTPGVVTMAQFSEDLAKLLDALGVNVPVTFCGLSMGGYIGWQFAMCYPHRLSALVACDTRAAADTPEQAAGRRDLAQRVLKQGATIVADAMLPKLFGPDAIAKNAEYVTATRRVMETTDVQGIAGALQGMAERPDVRSWLPQIACPTLSIVGEHDVISPPQEMREWTASIPNARLAVVGDSGHMTPLENPAQFNASLAECLQR